MGQEVRGKPEAPALSPDPERSIGAYLARQRELRGISLDELATLTRIPRRSLERLESGIFDRAPDGFVRGFVRTVAAALGLDPDETVMRLLAEPAEDGDGGRAGGVAWARPGARWAALAAAVCLVAGLLAWLAASPRREPTAAEGEATVLRHDLIRELAREAAARPAPGVAVPQAGEAAAPPAAESQPAPAVPPQESAGATPTPDAPADAGEAPPAAPPAAPAPAGIP